MPNLGEEICGEYLKYILNCEFITYNVTNPDIQGEIDVIGINLQKKMIYICEVAVHTSGLQYVTDKRPDDYNRFMAKFEKDIDYAKKYFSDYEIIPMLWSPIVKISSEKAKYNTFIELENVRKDIKEKYKLNLELVINQKYFDYLNQLKEFASKETAELKSNVMRMFQIEKSLERHLNILRKKMLSQE
jgi:hypothetical protein